MNYHYMGRLVEALLDEAVHTVLELRKIAGEGHSPRAGMRRSVPDHTVVLVDGAEYEKESLLEALKDAARGEGLEIIEEPGDGTWALGQLQEINGVVDGALGVHGAPASLEGVKRLAARYKEQEMVQIRYLKARRVLDEAKQKMVGVKGRRKWNRTDQPQVEKELEEAHAAYGVALNDLRRGRVDKPDPDCICSTTPMGRCPVHPEG